MNRKMQAIIMMSVIFILFGTFLIILHIVGDKPREESKILYLGPSKIDVSAEKEYNDALSKASMYEKDGNIRDAIKYYDFASKINRIYMPSYYPLFNIAKLQCKIGNKKDAVNTINIFLSYANDEVSGINGTMFIIENNNKEQLNKVKRQISEAKQLLIECR